MHCGSATRRRCTSPARPGPGTRSRRRASQDDLDERRGRSRAPPVLGGPGPRTPGRGASGAQGHTRDTGRATSARCRRSRPTLSRRSGRRRSTRTRMNRPTPPRDAAQEGTEPLARAGRSTRRGRTPGASTCAEASMRCAAQAAGGGEAASQYGRRPGSGRPAAGERRPGASSSSWREFAVTGPVDGDATCVRSDLVPRHAVGSANGSAERVEAGEPTPSTSVCTSCVPS